MYNVTNHTLFGVASTVWGATNFGQVTNNPEQQPQIGSELSGRIDFQALSRSTTKIAACKPAGGNLFVC